jgi:hypothetical protein
MKSKNDLRKSPEKGREFFTFHRITRKRPKASATGKVA